MLLKQKLKDLKPKKGKRNLHNVDEDVESDDENDVDEDDDGNVEYDVNPAGRFFVLFLLFCIKLLSFNMNTVSQSASTKIQEAQLKVNRDVQVAQTQSSLALTVYQDPPTKSQRSVEEAAPLPQSVVKRDAQVAYAQPGLAMPVNQDPTTQPQRSAEEAEPLQPLLVNLDGQEQQQQSSSALTVYQGPSIQQQPLVNRDAQVAVTQHLTQSLTLD